MTLDLTSTTARPQARPGPQASRSWRGRRQERERLAAQDRISSRLAELHHLDGLLLDARDVILAGWLQDGWFSYLDGRGQEQTVTVPTLRALAGRPVTGACLVGAVIQAGGGLSAAGSQPVQRALDLTWHTLHGVGPLPSSWCPAPSIRATHIRQLTRWNDSAHRTAADVADLLTATLSAAGAESVRMRAVRS